MVLVTVTTTIVVVVATMNIVVAASNRCLISFYHIILSFFIPLFYSLMFLFCFVWISFENLFEHVVSVPSKDSFLWALEEATGINWSTSSEFVTLHRSVAEFAASAEAEMSKYRCFMSYLYNPVEMFWGTLVRSIPWLQGRFEKDHRLEYWDFPQGHSPDFLTGDVLKFHLPSLTKQRNETFFIRKVGLNHSMSLLNCLDCLAQADDGRCVGEKCKCVCCLMESTTGWIQFS